MEGRRLPGASPLTYTTMTTGRWNTLQVFSEMAAAVQALDRVAAPRRHTDLSHNIRVFNGVGKLNALFGQAALAFRWIWDKLSCNFSAQISLMEVPTLSPSPRGLCPISIQRVEQRPMGAEPARWPRPPRQFFDFLRVPYFRITQEERIVAVASCCSAASWGVLLYFVVF